MCVAIEVSDIVGGEETRADISYKAANGMHGKNIQGVVDSQEKLELSSVVGKAGPENSVNDCSPGRNKAFEGLDVSS